MPSEAQPSGWLALKGGGDVDDWSRRFFVLSGSTLRCYASDEATNDRLLAVYELAGGSVRVPFEVRDDMLRLINGEGAKVLYHGSHTLEVSADGAGAPSTQSFEVVV